MNARIYLALARRWWWTVVSAMIAASVTGFLAVQTVPPTYEAETRMLVGPVNAELDTLRASALLVETYAELVHNDEALTTVIDEFGLQTTLADLRDDVRAVANPITRLLTIEVAHTDPTIAAQLATALGDDLIDALGPAVSPAGSLRLIDAAQPPIEPVAPNVPLLTGLSAAGGLAAALVLALLVERFSNTVNSRFELTELSGAPFLGSVLLRGRFRPTAADPLVVDAQPGSEASLSARLLTGKVGLASPERPSVILIIGSEHGDGVGELAANMAAIWGRSLGQTVLLDADDADGEATRLFGVSDEVGLSELLSNSAGATSSLVQAALFHYSDTLAVLPRGRLPLELVDRAAASRVVTELQKRGKMVVISAGPVHRSASTVVWARIADIVVLVAQRDATKRDHLRYAIETLQLTGTNIGGVALLERGWRPFSRGSATGRRSARPARSSVRDARRGSVIATQAAPAGREVETDRRT